MAAEDIRMNIPVSEAKDAPLPFMTLPMKSCSLISAELLVISREQAHVDSKGEERKSAPLWDNGNIHEKHVGLELLLWLLLFFGKYHLPQWDKHGWNLEISQML